MGFPWGRKWQPTPVFLPGKSHAQRSLAGYGPWGRKESNTTEQLHSLAHSHGVCSGESVEVYASSAHLHFYVLMKHVTSAQFCEETVFVFSTTFCPIVPKV